MPNIYIYLKDKFGIDVVDYTFKRDYIINPLGMIGRYRELADYEDIDYLYNYLHLSKVNIAKLMKVNRSSITLMLSKYNIKLKPYINMTDDDKMKAYMISQKYNIDYSKMKRNYISNPLLYNGQKYEDPYKEDVCYLYQDIHMERDDIINYFGLNDDLFTKLLKRLNIRRQVLSSRKIQIPIYEELFNLYYVKNLSMKELCAYYNVKNSTLGNWLKYYNIKKGRKKSIINMYKTNFEKYGVAQPSISQEEMNIFNKIITLFPNAKRHYKSNAYPFHCDFYIPEIDTYIEYQGYWTHGPYKAHEPFDPTNKQHLIILNELKSKNTDSYNNAIENWTIRDPMKRQVAKNNNLNYIEWFSINEFNEWFNIMKNNIDKNNKE